MKHTPEQLAGMNCDDLDAVLAHLLCEEWGQYTPRYCADWAATGPLMVEYGVTLIKDSEGFFTAYSDIEGYCGEGGGFIYRYASHGDFQDNPLRAVVECLILVLQEGE